MNNLSGYKKQSVSNSKPAETARHFFHFIFVMLLIGSCGSMAQNDVRRSFSMGFTPWLYDFTPTAIESTYSYINSHSDIISHHLEQGIPWSEALAKKSYHANLMWEWNFRKISTASNLKVFVSISPLNQSRTGLADSWGSSAHMPLPAAFAGKRLNDPAVKQSYLNYAESVISFFAPDYLAIAVEANELYFNNSPAWADFTELYIETYTALKLRHPDLPVFFTSSLHAMNQMRKDSDLVWNELSMLWNYSDIAAFSFYPYMQYPLDLKDPVAILRKVRDYTDKAVAISESGYPAQTIEYPGLHHIPADERLQGEMLFRMLIQAYVDKYVFYVAWAHRDFDQLMTTLHLPIVSALWRDTGLLSETGEARFSSQIWDAFYNLPLE